MIPELVWDGTLPPKARGPVLLLLRKPVKAQVPGLVKVYAELGGQLEQSVRALKEGAFHGVRKAVCKLERPRLSALAGGLRWLHLGLWQKLGSGKGL